MANTFSETPTFISKGLIGDFNLNNKTEMPTPIGCPICGDVGEVVYGLSTRARLLDLEKRDGYIVRCSSILSCVTLVYWFYNERDAIETWNIRQPTKGN